MKRKKVEHIETEEHITFRKALQEIFNDNSVQIVYQNSYASPEQLIDSICALFEQEFNDRYLEIINNYKEQIKQYKLILNVIVECNIRPDKLKLIMERFK